MPVCDYNLPKLKLKLIFVTQSFNINTIDTFCNSNKTDQSINNCNLKHDIYAKKVEPVEKKSLKNFLKWFLGIALGIPNAHDFLVISARI